MQIIESVCQNDEQIIRKIDREKQSDQSYLRKQSFTLNAEQQHENDQRDTDQG